MRLLDFCRLLYGLKMRESGFICACWHEMLVWQHVHVARQGDTTWHDETAPCGATRRHHVAHGYYRLGANKGST